MTTRSSIATSRPGAFSLVEVVLLIGLVVLAVLGLLSVQFFALRSNRSNSAWLTAATIADSELARVVSEQRRNFSSDCSSERTPVAGQSGFETKVAQSFYEGDPILKQIRCSVYFTDTRGEHEFRCQTMLNNDEQ